jgi:hypothetical protein
LVQYQLLHAYPIAHFSSHHARSTILQTYLVNRHELKEIVRFDYVHGDIKWDPRNSVVYPFFFMCSGLCAGMFGIGKLIATSESKFATSGSQLQHWDEFPSPLLDFDGSLLCLQEVE